MLRRCLVALATLTASIAAAGPGLAAPDSPAATTGPPVVVEFEPGSSPAERQAELRERGLEVVEVSQDADFALVEASGAASAVPGGAIADADPLVRYRAFGVPNDPAWAHQWHLHAIGVASAWDVTDGAGAVVAVIDTGVAYSSVGGFLRAPDLAGTQFVAGWDFVDGDAYPHDANGHGTHVASTIAATTNNGLGVAGAAPGARIMPLRVLDAAGTGTDWDTAQALRFAADNGADVANLSLGSSQASSVMADAIAYARGQGVTVVAASGNEGSSTVSYPAAAPGVIAVGAVRYDLARSGYSNHGSALDLVAPGGDMGVNQNGDRYPDGILQESFVSSPSDFCYCFFQGTSMATPQVSAVAALLAARGASGPDAVEQVLAGTARDLGTSGRDDSYGHGMVDASAAVRAALPTTTAPDSGGTSAAPPTEPTDPVATEPAPSDPVTTDPAPTDPAPEDPAPEGPAPSDPVTTDPAPTDPAPSDPVTTDPAPTDPAPTTGVRGIEHACPSGVTPRAGFTDLAGSVHAASVGCVAWWGVASGRTATLFEPTASMTRAQLASFVARMLDESGVALPASPPDAFSDDQGSTHEHRIDQLAALGVVRGKTATTYAPGATVTRAEMATFLVRAHDLVADQPLPAGPDRFRDDDTSTHEANIDKVATAGLAAGTSATTFAPTAPVLRAQMATFVARTLDLFVDTGAVPPR